MSTGGGCHFLTHQVVAARSTVTAFRVPGNNGFGPVPKGVQGVRKNLPARPQRSAQPKRILDCFRTFCEQTALQSLCFYHQMRIEFGSIRSIFFVQKCFGFIFSKKFPGGACSQTPPLEELGLSTSSEFGPPNSKKNQPVWVSAHADHL